ncbi:hypothetical protein M011DRAFT_473422 [Sporormia fimetaria CBS 119925]|uniref:Uncharacterized protein n=1 Tax=Sporormia fimetaria CBS 119925 TaxID=1340428 RepID=A0A6A6VNG5_9PLEO|nr:hypothetical protein M011DRAFT_473422 [Sporormia fimetaria CBS 119925]
MKLCEQFTIAIIPSKPNADTELFEDDRSSSESDDEDDDNENEDEDEIEVESEEKPEEDQTGMDDHEPYDEEPGLYSLRYYLSKETQLVQDTGNVHCVQQSILRIAQDMCLSPSISYKKGDPDAKLPQEIAAIWLQWLPWGKMFCPEPDWKYGPSFSKTAFFILTEGAMELVACPAYVRQHGHWAQKWQFACFKWALSGCHNPSIARVRRGLLYNPSTHDMLKRIVRNYLSKSRELNISEEPDYLLYRLQSIVFEVFGANSFNYPTSNPWDLSVLPGPLDDAMVVGSYSYWLQCRLKTKSTLLCGQCESVIKARAGQLGEDEEMSDGPGP